MRSSAPTPRSQILSKSESGTSCSPVAPDESEGDLDLPDEEAAEDRCSPVADGFIEPSGEAERVPVPTTPGRGDRTDDAGATMFVAGAVSSVAPGDVVSGAG